MVASGRLLLGVDGGGSGTTAWLAEDGLKSASCLSEGFGGASNPQVSGVTAATRELERAIAAAFAAAQLPPQPVAAACLCLAGVGRREDREGVLDWARQRQLAHRLTITHDADAVLFGGTARGEGIAVISGTGSLALGRDASGATARSGGWGYLFGDEGSGYQIALAGLRAAARAADGRGPDTQLLDRFVAALEVNRPEQLIAAVYGRPLSRPQLAALAGVVLECADHDPPAGAIAGEAARQLAEMVAAVANQLGLAPVFPLALGGGVLVHHAPLRQRLLARLTGASLAPQPVEIVAQPVQGAVAIARRDARA